MERKEIEERLRIIIADMLECETDGISDDTRSRDLGMDSLDEIEMLIEVEKSFGIYIEDEVANRVITFGDAVDVIMKKLEDKK